MKQRWVARAFVALLISIALPVTVPARDSLYGKVVEVKSVEVVSLDYGAGRFDVRIIGILAPKRLALDGKAKQFLKELILHKNARMRFRYRARNGEMVGRLFTDDPRIGIQDVGLLVVKAGWALRDGSYDDRSGELAAAQKEAATRHRGLWAASR